MSTLDGGWSGGSGNKAAFPNWFVDPMLRALSTAFDRRGKALRYQGELRWSTRRNDDFEWLTVSHQPDTGPALIAQFWEGNHASVFARSQLPTDRGRVLARLENARLVGNAKKIVGAFEETLAQAFSADPKRLQGSVERIWKPVCIWLADEQAH